MADTPELSLDAIAKLIDGKLSGLENNIMSRVGSELQARDAKLEAFSKSIEEAKTASSQSASSQAGSQSASSDGGDLSEEHKKQLAKFQAQADEALKKVEAANKAREEAEERAKKDRMVAQLESALAKKFPGANAENAKAWLLYHDRVGYDKDGNPGIKFKRNYGGYESEEILPLDKAIDEFAGTEQGKSFLPPSNAQGTGDRPRFTNAPRTESGQVDWDNLKTRVKHQGLIENMALGGGKG